eukprot:2252882-Ditylum_brightwellii.AAC.1
MSVPKIVHPNHAIDTIQERDRSGIIYCLWCHCQAAVVYSFIVLSPFIISFAICVQAPPPGPHL